MGARQVEGALDAEGRFDQAQDDGLAAEHAAVYTPPSCPSTVVIYSGFGFKGRNVIAVRSSDIVILVAGGIGTLK